MVCGEYSNVLYSPWEYKGVIVLHAILVVSREFGNRDCRNYSPLFPTVHQ